MRSDMDKVLVERPRHGNGGTAKGYQKSWQRTPPEEWRRCEGMRVRGGRSKWFSDQLGPLRRFLRSNVGRPWNKVHSEICAQLRRSFPVRQHFLRHVLDFVEIHVVLIDGAPCNGDGRLYGEPLSRLGRRSFYVCPRTGLLRTIPPRRRSKINDND